MTDTTIPDSWSSEGEHREARYLAASIRWFLGDAREIPEAVRRSLDDASISLDTWSRE